MTITEIEKGMKSLKKKLEKAGYEVELEIYRSGPRTGGWTGSSDASSGSLTIINPDPDAYTDLYEAEVEADYNERWGAVKKDLIEDMRDLGIKI